MDEVIADGSDADWSRPSPCDGWDATAVLAHATGTVGKVDQMLSGDGYAGQPAEAESGDAQAVIERWREVSGETRKALLGLDVDVDVQTPSGPQPIGEALALPVADIAVHSWDIAVTLGVESALPLDLLRHVEGVLRSVPEEVLRKPGVMGPAVEPAADADDTDGLMAFLGRSRP